MSLKKLCFNSWILEEGNVTNNADIDEWIGTLNKTTKVEIDKIDLQQSDFWFYDEKEGVIRNKNHSFFTINGFQRRKGDEVIQEQPVIVQAEIGYLGIICKIFDGVLNFLMQAKVEPGNLNNIQLSPTIQATKSNFMRKHGGKKPHYLEYFMEASKFEIIVDQLQSEQSSRFYKKRNRNIIIKVDDEGIVLEKNFKWMTLGQIKRLMKRDNIVNMDTRTVLSCIPYYNHALSQEELGEMMAKAKDKYLFKSVFCANDERIIPRIYQFVNNVKMFDKTKDFLVPLNELSTWEKKGKEFACKHEYDFKVVFCDIMIEGREVVKWTQPLFEANGIAMFGLFTCVENEIRKFLVKAKKEIGCFDCLELGPTVQIEPSQMYNAANNLTSIFLEKLDKGNRVRHNVLLSEEGGRFYHEQNQNVIIEIEKEEVCVSEEDGYFWVDYSTLNQLVQFNNCLNIQLRNLISLLEV